MAGCEVKAGKRCALYCIQMILGPEGFHSHTTGRITATTAILTVRLDRQGEEAAQMLYE